MPLKALVDGKAVISFDQSVAAWQQLKLNTRRGTAQALMPCGVRAVPKTSSAGLRFFAHLRRGTCTKQHKPETEEHRRLKVELLLGCRDAGWEAEPEVDADDDTWRADVLAERAGRRVAFEVQWTRQSVSQTEIRQAAYARDGVRCVWLFRHLPMLDPRPDLPAFALSADGNPLTSPTALIGDRPYSVRHLAALYVGDQMKFSPVLRVDHDRRPGLTFDAKVCPGCSFEVYFLSVGVSQVLSPCGRPLPAVQRAIEAASRTQQDSIARQPTATLPDEIATHMVLAHLPGKEYVGYVGGGGYCPRCHADMPRIRTRPTVVSIALPVFSDTGAEPFAHWCVSTTGRFCCDPPLRAV